MDGLATTMNFILRHRRSWHRACVGLAMAALFAQGACAHATIPGTQVLDTPPNREVYGVLKEVKIALESRDADRLLGLVSPRYFEDNGTPDPKDDYGYLELRESLVKEAMETAKDISLSVQLYDIEVDGDHAWADLRYTSRARLELPSGRLWDSHRDFDRIELVREDGRWLIVRGL